MRILSISIVAGIVMALTPTVSALMFFAYESVVDGAIVVNIGQEYAGSTIGATFSDESSCGYNDKYAVWHSYTPQSDQTVKIDLCGSMFDTTLAVFDVCDGIELACNDDYCDLQSELTVDLTAGRVYLIRVAGYDGQMGDYILSITETAHAGMDVDLTIDNRWMYQNMPDTNSSKLTANVSIIDDPMGNTNYSCKWEFVLPPDVNIVPATVNGGRTCDTFWTFAAPPCDQLWGLSDSGRAFTVKVTVTGNDHGNTATAKVVFGIALLGDVDNNGVVDLQDRVLVNAFWRGGTVGFLSLRDCDVNCDGVVDVTDRAIVNAIFQDRFGQKSVSTPCLLRYKKL